MQASTANIDEDVANELFDEDARLDDLILIDSVFIDPTITVNSMPVRLSLSMLDCPGTLGATLSTLHLKRVQNTCDKKDSKNSNLNLAANFM